MSSKFLQTFQCNKTEKKEKFYFDKNVKLIKKFYKCIKNQLISVNS